MPMRREDQFYHTDKVGKVSYQTAKTRLENTYNRPIPLETMIGHITPALRYQDEFLRAPSKEAYVQQSLTRLGVAITCTIAGIFAPQLFAFIKTLLLDTSARGTIPSTVTKIASELKNKFVAGLTGALGMSLGYIFFGKAWWDLYDIFVGTTDDQQRQFFNNMGYDISNLGRSSDSYLMELGFTAQEIRYIRFLYKEYLGFKQTGVTPSSGLEPNVDTWSRAQAQEKIQSDIQARYQFQSFNSQTFYDQYIAYINLDNTPASNVGRYVRTNADIQLAYHEFRSVFITTGCSNNETNINHLYNFLKKKGYFKWGSTHVDKGTPHSTDAPFFEQGKEPSQPNIPYSPSDTLGVPSSPSSTTFHPYTPTGTYPSYGASSGSSSYGSILPAQTVSGTWDTLDEGLRESLLKAGITRERYNAYRSALTSGLPANRIMELFPEFYESAITDLSYEQFMSFLMSMDDTSFDRFAGRYPEDWKKEDVIFPKELYNLGKRNVFKKRYRKSYYKRGK